MSTSRARVVTAEQWGRPERNEAGEPICRWCRSAVARPRRTFCREACVYEWKVRSSPWYVRREVKKRDKGICRLCDVNVVKAHREWVREKPPASDRAARKQWRAARPRWEADHIIPVADGGGECGLDNYRLLCRSCHLHVTLAWRARRAATRRKDGGDELSKSRSLYVQAFDPEQGSGDRWAGDDSLRKTSAGLTRRARRTGR